MTAIAGCFRLPSQSPLEVTCKQAIRAMQDYGSRTRGIWIGDDLGVAISPFPVPVGRQFEQPFADADRWVAAIDARLDNGEDLVRELALPPVRGGRSDAAILFHAWRRWEADVFDHLVGDFALVVFDRHRQTLTLARDATGQRPLYFAQRDGGVAFASMPSGIRALLPGAEPNFDKVAADLAELIDDRPETIFLGIERVRPGEVVTIGTAGVRRRQHWQPRTASRGDGSDADFVARYRAILDASVGSRLRGASRPIGAQLSAGYDSNAVVATAARLLGDPSGLMTFTSAPIGSSAELGDMPRGRFADESVLAAVTAERYKVRHLVLRDDSNIFDAIRRQGSLCQLPILSPFNMSWWSAIRRSAQASGVSVMLTAELGNQSLNAGGLAILGDYTRSGRWWRWWREARANAPRGDVRWRGILFNSFGNWLPPGAVDALRASVHHIASSTDTTFVRPEWLARLERSGRERFRPSGNSYADRLRLIRADDVGPYRKAAIADCGMEERDVMSDRRAIEFSLTLPPEQMLRNGVSRPLARAALADRVPGQIIQSPLRGLQSADWHLRLNQQAARDVFEEISACHRVDELLDLSALEQAIADWPRSGWDKGHHQWKYFIGLPAALATGIFLKEFDANA